MKKKLKTSPHLVKIRMGENTTAVFHSFFGSLSVLNSDAVKILDEFRKPQNADAAFANLGLEDHNTILSRFLRSNYLIPASVDEREEIHRYERKHRISAKKGRLFRHLRFDWTHQCNFRCRYCYGAGIWNDDGVHHPSVDRATQIIDSCFHLARQVNSKSLSIRFFGGEPLLFWEPMKEAISYARAKIPAGLQLVIYVSTNGSLVTDEVAGFGRAADLQFIVSLDGPQTINDAMRVDAQGYGTHASIVSGIRLLRRYGNAVSIAAVVGPHNMHHLKDLVLEAEDLDVNHITIDPLAHETVDIEERDYACMAREIWDAWAFAKGLKIDLTGSWKELLERLVSKNLRLYYCPAFGSKICVQNDGLVNPCSVLPLELGNLNRHRLSEIFGSKPYDSLLQRVAGSIEMCRGCNIEGLCLGGCPGNAYSAFGTHLAGSLCAFKKEIVGYFIERLGNSDAEWFK